MAKSDEPVKVDAEVMRLISTHWVDDFKPVEFPKQTLDFVVRVAPGESIQNAIDQVKAKGGGVVELGAGLHSLADPVVVCDGLTMVGAGRDYTILKKTVDFTGHTIRHSGGALRDVVLKDFTLDGNGRTGQGINFSSGIDDPDKQGNRILLQGVTVRNVYDHGMATSRVSNLIFDRVHLMYNGNHSELFHNLYLLAINMLLISDCDLSRTKAGKGLKLTRVKDAVVQRVEIRDLLWNGIQIDDEARRVAFHDCHFENCGRTAMWFICEKFGRTETRYTSDPQYAPQDVLIHRCKVVGNTRGAVFKDARRGRIVSSEFRNRENDIITLRCVDEVKTPDCTISRPPLHATQPEDVSML
jgi:hypothetical protein